MAIEDWSGVFNVNPNAGTHRSPSVATLPDGRFVVVWTADNDAPDGLGDDSASAIHGRIFNPDGTFQTNTFRVNATTANAQLHPEVTVLNSGCIAVVWEDLSSIYQFTSDLRFRISDINLAFTQEEKIEFD